MHRLPCDHVGGRYLLRVPLPTDRTVRMLVDTGGGFAITEQAATGLERVPNDQADGLERVRLPLDPPVLGSPDVAAVVPNAPAADGVLPAQWFAERIWTFDHGAGTLALHDCGDPPPAGIAIPLGFRSADGRRTGHFPRITVTVDDEPIDLLLDTGATATLTDRGLADLGEPRYRSSSFITAATITRWRRRHPDWPVIERPTTLAEIMIKVPAVTIAADSDHPGVDLGPVWFESRPDQSFHRWMSQWMDRQIDGALGNNAFARRTVALDYPSAVMWVR